MTLHLFRDWTVAQGFQTQAHYYLGQIGTYCWLHIVV